MKLAETNFANNTAKLAQEYNELKENCENEYLSLLEEEAKRFNELLTTNREELRQLEEQLIAQKRAV